MTAHKLAVLVLLSWSAVCSAQMQQPQTGGVSGGVGGLGGALGGGALGGGALGGGGAAGMAGGQSFSGGQALQGGLGALGQAGGSTSNLAGQALTPGATGSTGVGATSFMGPYFVNPLSLGIPTSSNNTGSSGGMGSGKPSFGVPLYNASQTGSTGPTSLGRAPGTTGTTGAGARNRTTTGVGGQAGRTNFGGGVGGFQGGLAGRGGLGGGLGGGVSNAAGIRAPVYATTIAFPTMSAPQFQAQVRTDLQNALSRSSALASRDRIQTLMEGDTVVLRGTVGSDQERRLAEAMARLQPGVFNLRNDLEVQAQPPRP